MSGARDASVHIWEVHDGERADHPAHGHLFTVNFYALDKDRSHPAYVLCKKWSDSGKAIRCSHIYSAPGSLRRMLAGKRNTTWLNYCQSNQAWGFPS